ncbi:MAG: pantoate--beta-alanine ligase [Pseudomonadota bacterium]|nr:pantoate--beta-alanine ligase [Pseudomonadota bacterium]
MQLTIAHDMESLQKALTGPAMAGKRIALVPTMGALHDGHMALINHAKETADEVVLTIFVNPKQFSANEDFSKYPRMLKSDINKLDKAGVAIVYTPPLEDVYPDGYTTTVSVGALGDILCGKTRPGHFNGVATVVTKLLLRVLPHVAVFGEKDYQQLCVIRRIVTDLDISVDIIGLPTVREADGLAMSSRNAYLSTEERKIAPGLYEVLSSVGNTILSGGVGIKSALDQGAAALVMAGFKVDYLELHDAETLAMADNLDNPARLLAAAWLGNTRLIDNIAIG